MMKNKINWKVIAIVFIVLFVVETIFLVWATAFALKEERNAVECLYDICEDYPDGWYESNVCWCYDYNEYNQLEIVKEIYMK